MTPALVVGAILGLIACLALSWRQCVKIVLVMLVFEGAIRKWVLPGMSDLVYFLKDGVMLLAYCKYYLGAHEFRGHEKTPTLLNLFLATSFGVVLLQSFNVNLGSPLVGIMGARNYLLYIPLMFLVRDLFRTENELLQFLRMYLLLVLPLGVLAFQQYNSSASSALNAYAWGNQTLGKARVSGAIRATGTFSYIAGYAAYLQTCAAFCMPFLLIRQNFFWLWLLRFVFVCIMGSMLLTGSRGLLLVTLAMFVGYVILNQDFFKRGLYKRLTVFAVVAFLLVLTFMGPQALRLQKRFTSNTDLSSRITAAISDPFEKLGAFGLFAYGSGASYQASEILRRKFNLPSGTRITAYLEAEPERILAELGPIGFLFWYGMRVLMILYLWLTYKRLERPFLRELALVAFLLQLITLPGQMVFQITYMVYFWFTCGFVLLLPQIENNEEEFERQFVLANSEAIEESEREAERHAEVFGLSDA